jgi:hypothetical protein
VKGQARYLGFLLANGLVVALTTLIGARFHAGNYTDGLIIALAGAIGVQFAITWKVIERNGSKAK